MNKQTIQKMKYKRIEAGVRFGRLICREIASEGGFGGNVWRCMCKCGTAIEVSEAMLLSRVVRSCGCANSHAINLQGQRIGMLTVLEPVPERGTDGSVKWLCRCNCGRYLVQSSNKLRMGRSVSCGCQTGIAAREAKTYIDGTCLEIMLSETISKNNTSGIRGVAKKRDRWQAYINYGGRRIPLGNFDTKERAAEVRREAEQKIREHLEGLLNETRVNAEEEVQWQTETFLRN